MSRMDFPLTPASSTDITGKDGTKQLSQLQMAFELPPAAITSRSAGVDTSNTNMPGSPVSQASPGTPYPIQPSEAVKSRRRTTAAANKDSDFTLPPPPPRIRKIIQMKPRDQDEKKSVGRPTASGRGSVRNTDKRAAATPTTSEGGASSPARKKQASATGAAGRKVARKTAHSLIERRRRSKMNEEFSVLKDMVPACSGEMHKLAILQASIDYVRYLHDCIEKLKAQREEPQTQGAEMSGLPSPSAREPNCDIGRQYSREFLDEEQAQPDVEMTGSDGTPSSPADFTAWPSTPTTATYSSHHQPLTSPALLAQDPTHRHGSYSSASTTAADHHHHRYYSYSYSSSSAATSPAVGPQAGGYNGGYTPGGDLHNHQYHCYYSASRPGSALTSPALGPLEQRELDQEATAALLMLNVERRGTAAGTSSGGGGGTGTGRGMSVRDLLSA